VRQIPLLAAQIARPLVGYLDEIGADSASYLNRVRIPVELIYSGGWVGKKQVYDLLYDVGQRVRHPGVVFSAFSRFRIDDLGPIAAAMRSSRTVMDAMRVLTRLAGLAYEGNDYFLQTDGKTAWLCYREGRPVSIGQVAAQQATLAIFLNIIRLSVGEHWRPQQIRSQVKMSSEFQLAEGWEECGQELGHDHAAIAFPSRFLRRSLAWAEEARSSLEEHLTWEPEAVFDDCFVDSLHRLIDSRFRFQPRPTLVQIAEIVGLSPRTIKRHLAAQGLTYRHLLDRICYDTALELLELQPQVSIEDVARALGYSSCSKFVRSFRRMTGMTPGAHRRLLQQGVGAN
jgi:AraC-like DNA-binding protein